MTDKELGEITARCEAAKSYTRTWDDAEDTRQLLIIWEAYQYDVPRLLAEVERLTAELVKELELHHRFERMAHKNALGCDKLTAELYAALAKCEAYERALIKVCEIEAVTSFSGDLLCHACKIADDDGNCTKYADDDCIYDEYQHFVFDSDRFTGENGGDADE